MKKIIILISILVISMPVWAYDIIPCDVGNRWEYETVKLVRANLLSQGEIIAAMNDASSGTSVYEVFGVDKGSSDPIYDYSEQKTMRSTNGSEYTEKTQIKLKSDNKGLHIISTYVEATGDEKGETQNYDPALLYFSKNAENGSLWKIGEMRDGNIKNFLTAKSVGKETVTVPAGTFKDCLKVVYSVDEVTGSIELWKKKFELNSGQSRGIYWIAEGIGVVKELQISTSKATSPGSEGMTVVFQGTTCSISELKPGYTVKNLKDNNTVKMEDKKNVK